jgi:hypothetical protein
VFVGALFVVFGVVCIGTFAVLARSSYPRVNAARLTHHRRDAALVAPVAEAWTRRTLWFGMLVGLLMLAIGVASIIISANQ